ncbi:hypothetical protein ACFWP2_10415 [Kitasatospora sp. NPDC058444]|uniref:hypothetical protein n=1 Tax=Kitasatospora sp. NPDC058444 TaxID=3346504 RepID=UPI0036591083
MELLEDELDPARWAHLCSGPDHYPGGGADIPEVLRGLAGAEDHAEARKWADRLYELVFHDHSGGYLLPAEQVAPQLVRLASSERAGVRAVALGFLVYLGAGGPLWAEDCPGAGGFDRRVTDAVWAGLETYYAQLKAPEVTVRVAAFVLITVLEHEAMLALRGAARMAAEAGPPTTSERYRRTVERLHEHDWDPAFRRYLGLAKVDPLFGHGEEYRGIEYTY